MDNKGIGLRARAGHTGDLKAAKLVAEGDAVDAQRLGFAPGREKQRRQSTDCDQSRPERGNHPAIIDGPARLGKGRDCIAA
jgi:hypothetical protein